MFTSSKKDIGFVSAAELLARPVYKITTSSDNLDKLFDDGIPTGQVIEIFGLSGVGKTTLCIQLAVNAQLPKLYAHGLAAESIFIDTEMTFMIDRVKQIAGACEKAVKKNLESSNRPQISTFTTSEILKSIYVYECDKLDELIKLIKKIPKYLEENKKIKLLIIDSLAFTCFDEDESFNMRTRKLYILGGYLHRLAFKYQIAIVVTNNMTTRVLEPEGKNYSNAEIPYLESIEIPCLGEAWSYLSNIKIELKQNDFNKERFASVRQWSGRKIPEEMTKFNITTAGIRDPDRL